METKLITLAFGLIAMSASAQTTVGKLVDEQQNPLPYANIVALSLPDSAFVSGAVSKDDGTFSLDAQGKEMILRITSMGYKTLYCKQSADLGIIKMMPETQVLGEVVVKSQLPKTHLKNGGMITNITGTILEKAGTAEMLLDRIPNVTAKNGKIEVFGRGTPIIYINGRQMRDRSELDNLSSDNIKSVEVITNPGARYAASTTSVIRITTKKPTGEGFGFDSRTYATYAELGDWSGTENLKMNYRTGGFDLSTTLYASRKNSHDDKDIEQFAYLDKTWHQVNPTRQPCKTTNLWTKLAMSYAFDTDNSVGASFSYDRYPEQTYHANMITSVYQDNVLSETSTSDGRIEDRETNLSVNTYYVGKIGKLGIDLNADWYRTKENHPEYLLERYTEIGQSEQQTEVNTQQNTQSDLLAARLVLTYPVLGGELGWGGEYSYSKRKNLYSALPAGLIDDDDSRINEYMTSVFIDYTRQIGNLSIQAGLRYEHVGFDYYEQSVLMSEQSRKYDNWFPSLSLSMPIGNVQMQLSYASDIERPSYWKLRGSTEYINRYTYQAGNPLLLPSITRNLSYALSYKWMSFAAMYSHVSDPILMYGNTYKNSPETMLLTSDNCESYNNFKASLSLQPKFGIWQPALQVALIKQWFKMETHDGNILNNPYAQIRLNNTVSTKLCDITLMMTATTEGGTTNYFQTRVGFNTDLMLYKSLCKDKLTLQLYITDIFGTGDSYINAYYGKLRTMQLQQISRSAAQLTVRYRFNVGTNKYKGTGAGNSQRDRM